MREGGAYCPGSSLGESVIAERVNLRRQLCHKCVHLAQEPAHSRLNCYCRPDSRESALRAGEVNWVSPRSPAWLQRPRGCGQLARNEIVIDSAPASACSSRSATTRKASACTFAHACWAVSPRRGGCWACGNISRTSSQSNRVCYMMPRTEQCVIGNRRRLEEIVQYPLRQRRRSHPSPRQYRLTQMQGATERCLLR